MSTEPDIDELMRQWDYWRQQIAEGDKTSGPRDWFESVIESLVHATPGEPRQVTKQEDATMHRALIRSSEVIGIGPLVTRHAPGYLKEGTVMTPLPTEKASFSITLADSVEQYMAGEKENLRRAQNREQ